MPSKKVTASAAWPLHSSAGPVSEETGGVSEAGDLPLSARALPARSPGEEIEALLARRVDFVSELAGCSPAAARLALEHTDELTDIILALFLSGQCSSLASDPWVIRAIECQPRAWDVQLLLRSIRISKMGGEEQLALRLMQLAHGALPAALKLWARYRRDTPESLREQLRVLPRDVETSNQARDGLDGCEPRSFRTLGAHLVVRRMGYSHHGIYVGDGRVVHYSGLADGLDSGPVEEVDIETFAAGSDVFLVQHANPKFPADEIARRARSRLGESLYSVTANNCEHFCNWCIDDDHHSMQVDLGTAGGSAVSSAAAGLAARGLVSASGVGVVAGTSGAGVMSGLATVGGAVGGGAVAGIGVAAGLPALAMASLINNTVLADNPGLSEKERNARSAGRKATYVGAAGGVAGSIAAVSAAGTAGLSATGITTGLAAIGGTVGGGMAAGVVVATAAPVAAAAVVGVGLYKIVKWIKD